MLFLAFLLVLNPVRLQAFELCNNYENVYCGQKNLDKNDTCQLTVSNTTETCERLDYVEDEKLRLNVGEVFLYLRSEPGFTKLYLGFNLAKHWKRAVVKLADYKDPKSCQVFAITRNEFLNDNLELSCNLNEDNNPKKEFLLETFSENESQFSQKKILFDLPNLYSFRQAALSSPRHIFSYIDFTNPAKIFLKIQPLDLKFMVTHYKIEVFREKENHAVMLDVRLINANSKEPLLSFEYITYSEEGYYYFAVSEISKYCPEDFCYKTITPKVHITRRGRPLVIGIVGASFLIPFVLFSFYWWNHKYRNQGMFISDPIQKVLVIFKPSFDKHNEVVSALIDSIETLSHPPLLVDRINLPKVKEKTIEKFCSDNLILATHIVYINPPFTDDESSGLDYMTFNFLKEETKKVKTDRKLMVVRFPYSKIETPSILSKALHFDLIKDFPDFIKNFSEVQSHEDFCVKNVYMELAKKIESAKIEGDNLKGVPEIVVTEEVEEANEVDGLIGG